MSTQASGSKERLTPNQARAARRARRRANRKLRRYAGLAAIGTIAVLFIVALFLPGLSAEVFESFGSRGVPAGPGERIENQGREHIPLDGAHPPYNSVPATSGWHYEQPLAPVFWGVHDSFVPDEYRLHNMEHGGIGIHYACPDGCPDMVAELTDLVDRGVAGGLKLLMSPYPDMDSRLALTAWDFILKLDEYDEGLVKEFIDSHESSPNAPEPLAR